MNNVIQNNIYILKTTRQRILDVISAFKPEELNKTPTGFKNNMIWNAAHCLVTQNLLTYGLCALPFQIEQGIIDTFRKGTNPVGDIDNSSIEKIKELLLETPDNLLNDYKSGLFKSFQAYETSYGVNLNSIEEAIAFNNTHEALHLGYLMAMRKSIK